MVESNAIIRSEDVIDCTVTDVRVRPCDNPIYQDVALRLSSGIDVILGYSELTVCVAEGKWRSTDEPTLSHLPGLTVSDVWLLHANGGRVCVFFADDSVVLNIRIHDGNLVEHLPATQRLILLGSGFLPSSPPMIEGYFDRQPRSLTRFPGF